MVSVAIPKHAKNVQKAKEKCKKVNKINKNKPELRKLKGEKKPKVVETIQKIQAEPEKKKKLKYILPSKYVKEHIVTSCLDSLQQLATRYKKKNTIFDDETPIFAEIHCMKIQNTRGNIKFVLPHSTVASTREVCLITPDIKKGRKIDHEPTVDLWEELLKKAGVTEVKTVIPVRQLKVEYDQYELKRRLLTQHDFIMVDTKVLNHVSHLLGKMFFKKHNMLIPVRMHKEADLKKDIDVGLRTAMLRVNEGETSTIIVGHTGMPQNKLKENVLSLVEQIQTKYPGGEANIRSISLKLPLSLSLPLYATLRPASTVTPPRLTQKKPKHYSVLEDELSTFPGRKVRVAPDGTVHLLKTEDMESSDNDEDYKEEKGDKKDMDNEADTKNYTHS